MVLWNRVVSLALDPEWSAASPGLPNKVVHEAIGYLSSWAIAGQRHVRVSITGHSDGCLMARYFDKDDKLSYEIFALLSDDKQSYSFHS